MAANPRTHPPSSNPSTITRPSSTLSLQSPPSLSRSSSPSLMSLKLDNDNLVGSLLILAHGHTSRTLLELRAFQSGFASTGLDARCSVLGARYRRVLSPPVLRPRFSSATTTYHCKPSQPGKPNVPKHRSNPRTRYIQYLDRSMN